MKFKQLSKMIGIGQSNSIEIKGSCCFLFWGESGSMLNFRDVGMIHVFVT